MLSASGPTPLCCSSLKLLQLTRIVGNCDILQILTLIMKIHLIACMLMYYQKWLSRCSVISSILGIVRTTLVDLGRFRTMIYKWATASMIWHNSKGTGNRFTSLSGFNDTVRHFSTWLIGNTGCIDSLVSIFQITVKLSNSLVCDVWNRKETRCRYLKLLA